MRWLVGMELGDRGDGALGYAGWLGQASRTKYQYEGVHVLDRPRLDQLLRSRNLRDVHREAREAGEAKVERTGAAGTISLLSVVVEATPEGGLAKLAEQSGVAGLILGRAAPRESHRLVRLGRVARRTLRSLPAPTIVVPPDLGADAVGDGPVLLAVHPDYPAPAAVAFARRFAEDIDRPLVLVHVVETLQYVAVDFAPAIITPMHYSEMRARREQALSAWKSRHEVGDLSHQVVEGLVVEGLCQLGAQMRSPLIVCGSRELGLGMRLFHSSTTTALAANSTVPVAAVPEARS